ncbi:MAG TPA: formate dehydrogenase accessory sulfurtransferase FdhD [Paracoccaceae bacterium]
MHTHRLHNRAAFAAGRVAQGLRALPEEVAVALSYNGTTQAVMMATPDALDDFAYGFSLTEGIARPEEIDSITAQETARGIDLQIWLKPDAEARLTRRRRTMTGPVGCGLCGLDSLEEATREAGPVPPSDLSLTPEQIMQAIAGLTAWQPLHDTTHAVHAAGFWTPAQGIIAAREDVGRHNALDKLVGALLRPAPGGPVDPSGGAVVLTSRVSIDMVQKVAALGAPALIAVSAPTTTAVAMAEGAGITLIALARPDRFEVFTHPFRIAPPGAAPQESKDVA